MYSRIIEENINQSLAEWDLRDRPVQPPSITHEETEALRSLTPSRPHNIVKLKMKRKEIVFDQKSNSNKTNIEGTKALAPKQ